MLSCAYPFEERVCAKMRRRLLNPPATTQYTPIIYCLLLAPLPCLCSRPDSAGLEEKSDGVHI
jgi:hypothetical protein